VGPLLQVTRTVPIVFLQLVDPVGAGFVASLARPGGNATGFTVFEYGISGKWLELLKEAQLQFHYVDQCDGGRNAFRRISLTSAIMTRTGKLTTCSPCSSWRHTGIIAVSCRPSRGSNSLIPRTVDNEPIREIRCPLCTVANCPTRRRQYCYASIGPTPQRRRRRKPAYNRSSGRLWGLCSRCRDGHDLCPWIASPSSSMLAPDFGRCDGYHRMVDCIRAPKPRGFPPQSYCAGRARPRALISVLRSRP
jgi:hypothetical protein